MLFQCNLSGHVHIYTIHALYTYILEVVTVYALTFAGLNFRGSQILAIFAFLFLRMQGLSL